MTPTAEVLLLTHPRRRGAPPFEPRYPVVQAEEDVANALGIDAALFIAHHYGILVPELVLEHGAERRAERPVAEAVPHVEILAHAVHLDRLEHEMDGRGAE